MGIDVPAVYFVDRDRNLFIMEAIVDGEVISDFGIRLGRIIAKLHAGGIMHGDLTTSNMLLRNGNPETIVLIDFGLAESIV
ncbi:unnamed protein product [Gongylonema pulchrum]|uniref:non-specific serine/threonine protein kinase n=1 Tax=Gongylonema pulchrum TaxID=637853 RepID=A0A3P7NNP8_9BILA|nr:unnamed protein product [Gongylonema pulchrum]